MKSKKLISFLCAAALTVSSLAGLAVTASAADSVIWSNSFDAYPTQGIASSYCYHDGTIYPDSWLAAKNGGNEWFKNLIDVWQVPTQYEMKSNNKTLIAGNYSATDAGVLSAGITDDKNNDDTGTIMVAEKTDTADKYIEIPRGRFSNKAGSLGIANFNTLAANQGEDLLVSFNMLMTKGVNANTGAVVEPEFEIGDIATGTSALKIDSDIAENTWVPVRIVLPASGDAAIYVGNSTTAKATKAGGTLNKGIKVKSYESDTKCSTYPTVGIDDLVVMSVSAGTGATATVPEAETVGFDGQKIEREITPDSIKVVAPKPALPDADATKVYDQDFDAAATGRVNYIVKENAEAYTGIEGLSLSTGARSSGADGTTFVSVDKNITGDNILNLTAGKFSNGNKAPKVNLSNNLAVTAATDPTRVMAFAVMLHDNGVNGKLYIADNTTNADGHGALRDVLAVLSTEDDVTGYANGDTKIGVHLDADKWYTAVITVTPEASGTAYGENKIATKYRVYVYDADGNNTVVSEKSNREPAVSNDRVNSGNTSISVDNLPALSAGGAEQNDLGNNTRTAYIDNLITYTTTSTTFDKNNVLPKISGAETIIPEAEIEYIADGNKVQITTEDDASALAVIHAKYANGALSSVTTKMVELEHGAAELELEKQAEVGDKIMVWNSVPSAVPYAPAKTLTAEDFGGAAPVVTYAITTLTPENGTVAVTVDGTAATKAAAGKTVTIAPSPATGYEIDTIVVKDADNGTVTVTNNTFTMPAKAVNITVTFKQTAKLPISNVAQIAITGGDSGKAGAKLDMQVSAKDSSGFTDTDAFTYEWYKDDVKIEETAVDSTLEKAPAGKYKVVATYTGNDYTGAIESSEVTLAKNDLPSTVTVTVNATSETAPADLSAEVSGFGDTGLTAADFDITWKKGTADITAVTGVADGSYTATATVKATNGYYTGSKTSTAKVITAAPVTYTASIGSGVTGIKIQKKNTGTAGTAAVEGLSANDKIVVTLDDAEKVLKTVSYKVGDATEATTADASEGVAEITVTNGNIVITGVTSDTKKYAISGDISSVVTGADAQLTAVTVTDGADVTETAEVADGSWTVNVPKGTYTITPTVAEGYTASPANYSDVEVSATVIGKGFAVLKNYTAKPAITGDKTVGVELGADLTPLEIQSDISPVVEWYFKADTEGADFVKIDNSALAVNGTYTPTEVGTVKILVKAGGYAPADGVESDPVTILAAGTVTKTVTANGTGIASVTYTDKTDSSKTYPATKNDNTFTANLPAGTYSVTATPDETHAAPVAIVGDAYESETLIVGESAVTLTITATATYALTSENGKFYSDAAKTTEITRAKATDTVYFVPADAPQYKKLNTVGSDDATVTAATEDTPYSFTMPEKAVTVTVDYANKQAAVKYTAGNSATDNFTIAVTNTNGAVATDTKVDAGSKITVTATAAEGMTIGKITINEVDYTADDATNKLTVNENVATVEYTVPDLEDDIVISAVIAATTTYDVAISNADPEGGKVSVDKSTAAEGETVKITATPDANYEVDTVAVKGISNAPVAVDQTTYTFTMPAENVTVAVTFRATEVTPTTYTVTLAAGEGAFADDAVTSLTVADGAKISTATELTDKSLPTPTKDNYVFIGWKKGDTEEVVADNTALGDETVTANITYTAQFEAIPQDGTIALSSEINGTYVSFKSDTADSDHREDGLKAGNAKVSGNALAANGTTYEENATAGIASVDYSAYVGKIKKATLSFKGTASGSSGGHPGLSYGVYANYIDFAENDKINSTNVNTLGGTAKTIDSIGEIYTSGTTISNFDLTKTLREDTDGKLTLFFLTSAGRYVTFENFTITIEYSGTELDDATVKVNQIYGASNTAVPETTESTDGANWATGDKYTPSLAASAGTASHSRIIFANVIDQPAGTPKAKYVYASGGDEKTLTAGDNVVNLVYNQYLYSTTTFTANVDSTPTKDVVIKLSGTPSDGSTFTATTLKTGDEGTVSIDLLPGTYKYEVEATGTHTAAAETTLEIANDGGPDSATIDLTGISQTLTDITISGSNMNTGILTTSQTSKVVGTISSTQVDADGNEMATQEDVTYSVTPSDKGVSVSNKGVVTITSDTTAGDYVIKATAGGVTTKDASAYKMTVAATGTETVKSFTDDFEGETNVFGAPVSSSITDGTASVYTPTKWGNWNGNHALVVPKATASTTASSATLDSNDTLLIKYREYNGYLGSNFTNTVSIKSGSTELISYVYNVQSGDITDVKINGTTVDDFTAFHAKSGYNTSGDANGWDQTNNGNDNKSFRYFATEQYNPVVEITIKGDGTISMNYRSPATKAPTTLVDHKFSGSKDSAITIVDNITIVSTINNTGRSSGIDDLVTTITRAE